MKAENSGYTSILSCCVLLAVAGFFWPGQESFTQDAGTAVVRTDSVPGPTDAKSIAEADATAELKPLGNELKQSLDETWSGINENSMVITELERRVNTQQGIMREVLEARLDTLFTTTLEDALRFVNRIADLRDDGYDISAYMEDVNWVLKILPPTIQEIADRIRGRVLMPDFSQSAAEQAATDEQFFAAARAYHRTDKALLATADADNRFAINGAELREYVRTNLADGAANVSVFLDLSIAQVNNLRAGIAALPTDDELKAKLKVAQNRVKRTAALLESQISIMRDLNIPTAQYNQQLLRATGAITASSLDIEVLSGLLRNWGNSLVSTLVEQGPGILFQLLLFVVIIYMSVKIGGLVQRGVDSALDANKQHLSNLLRRMLSSTSRNIVIVFGMLIALSQIGISLGPLLTGLGIAGFIVGFALQDSLSNFASGMLILFYRPFDVGDTIEAGGARGKVSHMSLVNTTILTFDNQSLIIPNNKIWQDVITNVTAQTKRRVDMQFGITYGEDIDRVEKLLLAMLEADERVLDDPEPVVKVGSFGDSSVNILFRPWVRTEDYWDVLWDFNKKVKQMFDREGITIPFPQRDVHVYQERAPEGKTTPVGPEEHAPTAPIK